MNQNNRKPKRDVKRDDYKGRAPKRKPEQETNNRPEQQDDFVIGKHAVYETLKSERDINKLFLQEGIGGEKIGEILELAKGRHIQITIVPKTKLDLLSDSGVHQGGMLATAAFQ